MTDEQQESDGDDDCMHERFSSPMKLFIGDKLVYHPDRLNEDDNESPREGLLRFLARGGRRAKTVR